jgi:hypothetical protein
LLANKLVEEFANVFLGVLDLRRLNVWFSPGIVQHRIEQILLQLPLLRLR